MKRLALLLFLLAGCGGESADAGPTIPDQGITREQAEQLWTTGTDPAIVRRWNCMPEYDTCEFQIAPQTWAQMEYDFKRDFVAGVGKAAAVIHDARYTNFQDSMTGAELATYSAQRQSVRIR